MADTNEIRPDCIVLDVATATKSHPTSAVKPTDRVARWIKDRRRPILAAVIYVTAAAFYSFEWPLFWAHVHAWAIPSDTWSTWRAAHHVGWGDIGDVYTDTTLVGFPGIAVVLAPAAILSGHLNLTESVPFTLLPKPTAWFVLGPALWALGTTTIFAAHRFGRLLEVRSGRQAVLCLAVAVPVYEMTAEWGHPEDCLALSLALWALVLTWTNRDNLSGWLWGLAIAIQPLVLPIFPLGLARVRSGSRLATCMRAAIPTVALIAIPLVTEWKSTTRAVVQQPTFPLAGHPTPFMALATRLNPGTVNAGPARLIGIALACGLGYLAYRWKPNIIGFAWMVALALTLRCVFEAVMYPYYLGPPLVVIFCVAAARRRAWPFAGAILVGFSIQYLSFRHWGEWPYWITIVSGLALALTFAWPGRSAFFGSTTDWSNEQGAKQEGKWGEAQRSLASITTADDLSATKSYETDT